MARHLWLLSGRCAFCGVVQDDDNTDALCPMRARRLVDWLTSGLVAEALKRFEALPKLRQLAG